jgi:ABC-type glycerol-3-phosphate transport system permease component
VEVRKRVPYVCIYLLLCWGCSAAMVHHQAGMIPLVVRMQSQCHILQLYSTYTPLILHLYSTYTPLILHLYSTYNQVV